MIEKDDEVGGYYVACDFCSNDVNIQQHDFLRAIEALKLRGWKIVRDGMEWLHKCPECQKSEG